MILVIVAEQPLLVLMLAASVTSPRLAPICVSVIELPEVDDKVTILAGLALHVTEAPEGKPVTWYPTGVVEEQIVEGPVIVAAAFKTAAQALTKP
jgi:hypothetical protein